MSLLKRKFMARKWEGEAVKYPGFIRKLDPIVPRKRRSRARSTADAADVSESTDPPIQTEL